MLSPHHIAWSQMEAERAFRRAKRRRRGRFQSLEVHDHRALATGGAARGGVREIPLAAIAGTFDAGRAREVDRGFRPIERPRQRWLRVWQADDLPPITVRQIGSTFAVLDGHHRVSVAVARGALTIPALLA